MGKADEWTTYRPSGFSRNREAISWGGGGARVPPDQRPSLPGYNEIADDLTARILDGELQVYMPPIPQLVEEYNSAYVTIRRALEVLEKRDMVVVTHGKRTRVVHGADKTIYEAVKMAEDLQKQLERLREYLAVLSSAQIPSDGAK